MPLPRIRLLLHALAVAAGVGAALGGAALMRAAYPPVAPPAGYVMARGDGLVVYAPSPQALRDAVDEVRSARETFRARFAADPVDVVVVVGDSPAALATLPLRRLRRKGAAFLPYVTREAVALPARGDEYVALDGGVVLERGPESARVAASGTGGARAAGLRRGDVVLALNGTADPRPDVLRRALDNVAPGALVRLRVRRDGALVHVAYPRGTVDDEAAHAHAAAAGRIRAGTNSLAHEVCHQLVAGRVRTGRDPGGGYGHPALPDWVDEMAAVLCESPASLARRRAYMLRRLDARIPLAAFATMEHPLAVALAVRGAGEGMADTAAGPVILLGAEETRALLQGMDGALFYAQALSLGEFILARGGPRALRTVTDQVARGRTLDQALARAARRAPGLPRTTTALEPAWAAWVRSGGS